MVGYNSTPWGAAVGLSAAYVEWAYDDVIKPFYHFTNDSILNTHNAYVDAFVDDEHIRESLYK